MAIVDQILNRLGEGTASSPELERLFGISQPTANRQLRSLLKSGRIIRIGARRSARYALLHDIAGIGSRWPLRRVDEHGAIHDLGELCSLASDEWLFNPTDATFASGGVTHGLPYFLQDQRPGGFLGRAVPLRYPELQLPQRVQDWNDSHYLRYLTQRGGDTIGNLILGDASLDEYLSAQRRREPVAASAREQHYPQFAEQVMVGGLPGSSAHGEHPKFATLIEETHGAQHVLVKFSPLMDTAVGQRWADLLVTEHLALEALAGAGVAAARSQIFKFAGRTYLEVERFDRRGVAGRIGVSSLLAIDSARYGVLDNWIAAAQRLHRDRRISDADENTIRLLATFGALIANTDRHFGNLSFFDRYDGRFELAPSYDMLPMLFAPEHSQLFVREFSPPDPTAETLYVYGAARALAEAFWKEASRDRRISADFRHLCAECGKRVEALPESGAYARSAMMSIQRARMK